MGVRGLQSYIERDCPGACKHISIKAVADEHRKKLNCDPVIVVDGLSLVGRLYSNSNLEWIYGGQWKQFVEELKNFITRFQKIGVKLVFFFDGTISDSKRSVWVQRRLTRLQEMESLFGLLEITHTEPDREKFQLPTSMGIYSRFAIQEMGVEVYATVREADDVIAEYANQNKEVCAILSQDSDFIIYNTKMYLSLNHLDHSSLTTIHYDRECFASRYLGLSVTQLPIFACLMGNDFLPADDLRPFHRRISSNGRVYMAAIAGNLVKIIKSKGWSGIGKSEMADISMAVFGNREYALQIEQGIGSYEVKYHQESPPKYCIEVHRDIALAAYEKHIGCHNAYVYDILRKLEYESGEVMEDTTRLPSALAYRQVRQRCYGVLSNSRDRSRIFSQEKTFSLEDLWFKCTETEKMQTFWAILELPMDFTFLTTLPEHLISVACILNYLIANSEISPQLKPWEVAVFIAQAVGINTTENLESLKAPPVDTHVISLSTLFMRGVTTVLMALSTCDFPVPLSCAVPWRFFDGKLFHHLYTVAKKKASMASLCPNKETVEEFYNILLAVTSNTKYAVDEIDWNGIIEGFDLRQY